MRKLICILLVLAASAFALERQPNADYRARREALAQKAQDGVILLFARMEDEGGTTRSGFRQDPNFFYLTGWNEPDAALVIAPAVPASAGHAGRPYTEILFLPAHNVTVERWTGPKLGPENPQARVITGVDRVAVLDSLREELVRILPSPRAKLYADLAGYGERSTATAPLDWLNRANAFPNYISFEDVKPLLAARRVVKDGGEMELIRKAVDASVAAHLAAMHAMKPGVTEREIAALMIHEFERRGCERPAYAPIVGAGFNSTVLHYDANSARIQAGEVVVLDAAGEYSMYAADITRTLPASGKFSRRQRELYDIVLGAQQAAMDAFQTGKYVLDPTAENSIHKIAYDYINTHGMDKHGQPLGKYFIHGLGHHIGLQVHDSNPNVPLDKGMVFTIEPGIYVPEENIGIRIEDMVWVDPNGKLVLLTGSLPRTADDVERAMQKR